MQSCKEENNKWGRRVVYIQRTKEVAKGNPRGGENEAVQET